MTLKKTDLAKRQGLQIALRMKNASKADLLDKQAKGKLIAKPAPLLQSILRKSKQDDTES
ncbi:MAG: hypothetical protein RLZZ365_194 [Pseudomonadota bacterium]|jgi:hypothetical protein